MAQVQLQRSGQQASWRSRAAGWRFSRHRADYYDYLASLLEGAQGRYTLKEVFERDIARHGLGTLRGRISASWLERYQAAGGDLYMTWLGAMPVTELGLIRAAQAHGNAALVHTFAELARLLQLMKRVRWILMSTLWTAALAAVALFAMLLAMPFFTVPRLLATFAAVPAEYYGHLTQSLVGVAEGIGRYWWCLLMAGIAVVGASIWSLDHLTGPFRAQLDKHGIWRIYRSIQALLYLRLLAILLGRDATGTTQLKTALMLQRTGMCPWQRWHVAMMLARIDVGLTGALTFHTGLLEPAHYGFLEDMVEARGLHTGLLLTSDRLKGFVLGTVARQAGLLRWTISLGCLACLLSVALWHYAVIDELRKSLMLFYASH